jgi:sugar/nucleoside kinase (ribokinase family)
MPRELDAIVAGELFVDLIMSGIDGWPHPGTEVFASSFHREIGGGAAITACGLARAGSRAGVMGVVGSDTGEWVLARLKQCGVETSLVACDAAEPTAFTVAATTPGDRAYLTYPGANRQFPAVLAGAAGTGQFARARHVHLACAPALDSAPDLLRAIRAEGCTVSLDVGWHGDWLADPRALECLPLVDIFFPNETEGRRMTGETAPEKVLERLHAAGARGVALKLGAQGAALLWGGGILRIEAHPGAPVDTTGAGDCFDAGFLHGWLAGEPPETCLRMANICGALSTEAYGGIDAFPSPVRLGKEMTQKR